MERSGPVHRLGAKLSEIQAGLRSVQKRLEQRSPDVNEAKTTQKVGRNMEETLSVLLTFCNLSSCRKLIE